MRGKTGILLVGFGGPRSLDEVAPMLERVMGISPPPSVVTAVQEKYVTIGGKSPVVLIAEAISRQLRTTLEESELTECIQHVQLGMCFTDPDIADGLMRLVAAGCERIIYLSMTPYDSWAAWTNPAERVCNEAAIQGISEVLIAPTFGMSDAYISGHIAQIAIALNSLSQSDRQSCGLVFAAHSLPLKDKHEDAVQYQMQLGCAGKAISTKLGLSPSQISFAYTSVGVRGGEWLEPTLDNELARLAKTEIDLAIVCPLGFATDHMEVLYDIDIAAVRKAHSLGIDIVRTPTLATTQEVSPALIAAMMNSIRNALNNG